MKKIITIIIFLTLVVSCEKDDICTSPNADTPHLIIRFYDNLNQDTPKAVTNLLIQGDGNPLSYGTESTTDSIAIPLRITEHNNTTYKLIKDFAINDNGTPDNDGDDFTEGVDDEIVITYVNKEVYISKACGFKNIFDEVSFGLDSNNSWIISREIITDKIENENNAHVHIYH